MESKPRVADGLISTVPTASVWWANCVAGRVEGPVFLVVSSTKSRNQSYQNNHRSPTNHTAMPRAHLPRL